MVDGESTRDIIELIELNRAIFLVTPVLLNLSMDYGMLRCMS